MLSAVPNAKINDADGGIILTMLYRSNTDFCTWIIFVTTTNFYDSFTKLYSCRNGKLIGKPKLKIFISVFSDVTPAYDNYRKRTIMLETNFSFTFIISQCRMRY